jgi:DASH complex subunit DAD1
MSLRAKNPANVVQVGNEFSQVEGLWSQLENVMAKQPESDASKDTKDGAIEEQNQ